MPASSTFDAICVRLTSAREQVAIRGVYRPVIYQCHSYEPISPPVILPTSIATCTINESSQLKLQLVVDCGQLATRHWTGRLTPRPPARYPACFSFPGNNRIPRNATIPSGHVLVDGVLVRMYAELHPRFVVARSRFTHLHAAATYSSPVT